MAFGHLLVAFGHLREEKNKRKKIEKKVTH
jgi:hypothetical protein